MTAEGGNLNLPRKPARERIAKYALARVESSRFRRLRGLVTDLDLVHSWTEIAAKSLRSVATDLRVPNSIMPNVARAFLSLERGAQGEQMGQTTLTVASEPVPGPPELPVSLIPACVHVRREAGRESRVSGVVVLLNSSLVLSPIQVSEEVTRGSILIHLTPDGAVCSFYDQDADSLLVDFIK